MNTNVCSVDLKLLIGAPFDLHYKDPVKAQFVITDDESQEEVVIPASSDQPLVIVFDTPEYVDQELTFGDSSADWNQVWFDKVRTPEELEANKLKQIKTVKSANMSLVGI